MPFLFFEDAGMNADVSLLLGINSVPDNSLDKPSVCRLISSLLRHPKLSIVYLDHEPSSCVRRACWRRVLGVTHRVAHVVAQRGWAAVIRHLRLRAQMHFCAHVTGVALRRLTAHLCSRHLPARLGLYPVPGAAMPLLPLTRARMHRLLCISGQALVLVRKMFMSRHGHGTWIQRPHVLRWICNAAMPVLMMGGNVASSLMYDHDDDGGDEDPLRLLRGDSGDDDDDDDDEDQDDA